MSATLPVGVGPFSASVRSPVHARKSSSVSKSVSLALSQAADTLPPLFPKGDISYHMLLQCGLFSNKLYVDFQSLIQI